MLCTLKRGGVQQINKASLTEKHAALCADCAPCVMYELNGERGKHDHRTLGIQMISRSELLSVLSIPAKHDLPRHTVASGCPGARGFLQNVIGGGGGSARQRGE